MKEIVQSVLDYMKDEGIPTKEVPKEMRKIVDEVYTKVFSEKDGLSVIKKDYRVEDFDENKIYFSMANASDSCKVPLTESDIKNILTRITNNLKDHGKNYIYTEELRKQVISEFEKSGFEQAKICYMSN